MLERRSFLCALVAAGVSSAALQSRARAAPAGLDSALVLSGGGARGAYQAGIVGALAATAGIADGTPLAPYDLVCGTSIGALNGWSVATARIPQAARALVLGSGPNRSSGSSRIRGVARSGERVDSTARHRRSGFGLTRNQSAVCKPSRSTTGSNVTSILACRSQCRSSGQLRNLTKQRPSTSSWIRSAQRRSARTGDGSAADSLGPQTVVREATPDLCAALLASAANPDCLDPVEMPGPDGSVNEYCDGGVASNSPVGVAHESRARQTLSCSIRPSKERRLRRCGRGSVRGL